MEAFCGIGADGGLAGIALGFCAETAGTATRNSPVIIRDESVFQKARIVPPFLCLASLWVYVMSFCSIRCPSLNRRYFCNSLYTMNFDVKNLSRLLLPRHSSTRVNSDQTLQESLILGQPVSRLKGQRAKSPVTWNSPGEMTLDACH